MRITQKEYEQILDELKQRFLDAASVSLVPLWRRPWPKGRVESDLDDFQQHTTELTFKFTIVTGDLRQILGQIRRRKLRS